MTGPTPPDCAGQTLARPGFAAFDIVWQEPLSPAEIKRVHGWVDTCWRTGAPADVAVTCDPYGHMVIWVQADSSALRLVRLVGDLVAQLVIKRRMTFSVQVSPPRAPWR